MAVAGHKAILRLALFRKLLPAVIIEYDISTSNYPFEQLIEGSNFRGRRIKINMQKYDTLRQHNFEGFRNKTANNFNMRHVRKSLHNKLVVSRVTVNVIC